MAANRLHVAQTQDAAGIENVVGARSASKGNHFQDVQRAQANLFRQNSDVMLQPDESLSSSGYPSGSARRSSTSSAARSVSLKRRGYAPQDAAALICLTRFSERMQQSAADEHQDTLRCSSEHAPDKDQASEPNIGLVCDGTETPAVLPVEEDQEHRPASSQSIRVPTAPVQKSRNGRCPRKHFVKHVEEGPEHELPSEENAELNAPVRVPTTPAAPNSSRPSFRSKRFSR